MTNQVIQPVSKQTDEITSGRRQSFPMHLHHSPVSALHCAHQNDVLIVSYDARSVKREKFECHSATFPSLVVTASLHADAHTHERDVPGTPTLRNPLSSQLLRHQTSAGSSKASLLTRLFRQPRSRLRSAQGKHRYAVK